MKSGKSSKHRSSSLSGEVHPDDGVDPRDFFGRSHRKRGRRKTLQLCAQVAQALDAALCGACGDEVLQDLTVQSVEPMPGGACLLVTLEVRPPVDGQRVQAAMEELQLIRGLLRSEVAASITRKRVPELAFRVMSGGEGER